MRKSENSLCFALTGCVSFFEAVPSDTSAETMKPESIGVLWRFFGGFDLVEDAGGAGEAILALLDMIFLVLGFRACGGPPAGDRRAIICTNASIMNLEG